MPRTIVVGDVHGCRDEFARLLDQVKYAQGVDVLVSLGDLTDRGPDPVGSIRLAREVGARLVQSNHDDKHVRYRRYLARKAAGKVRDGDKPPNLKAERIEQNALFSDEDMKYLTDAPDFIELKEFNFVAIHAGLRPRLPLPKQPHQEIIRCRWVWPETGEMADSAYDEQGHINQPKGSVPWMEKYDGPHNVVYGHAVHSLETPKMDLSASGFECWGVDTGCCFGGRLTALILDPSDPLRRPISQIQATKAHDEWYGREGYAD